MLEIFITILVLSVIALVVDAVYDFHQFTKGNYLMLAIGFLVVYGLVKLYA